MHTHAYTTYVYIRDDYEENEEEEAFLFYSSLHTLFDKWDLFDAARSIISDYRFPPVTRPSRPTL